MLSRRLFCQALPAGLASLAWSSAPPPRRGLTLGFSTYGFPKKKTEDVLPILAKIGFDSVELDVQPGRDAAPANCSARRRKELRALLGKHRLTLTALMENLVPSAEKKTHQAALDRLKSAAQLAHDLRPGTPPLIETTLGGGSWDKVKSLYRDRLGDWAKVVSGQKITLAIKPHRFGAMNLPEHAVWLIEQIRSPWLKLVFDYSHYDLRGLTMEKTVKASAKHLAFVAVKDVTMHKGKAVFLLPGEAGRIDYKKLMGLLWAAGYRGDVNCEVSGMVHGKPGYDATTAAEKCYKALAPAMKGRRVM